MTIDIRHTDINRKLIKLLVTHHTEYWKNRNKIYDDKKVNCEFMI